MKKEERGGEGMDRVIGREVTPVTILAGGRSRRMGVDKAFVEFQGQPLIRRMIDLSRSFSAEVSLILHPDQFTSQPYRSLAVQFGLDLIADDYDHHGPLGGLATALRYHYKLTDKLTANPAATPPAILLLPCDMPFLTLRLLEQLLRDHTETGAEATIVNHQNRFRQPLPGAYSTSILPVVTRQIESGQLKFDHIFSQIRTTLITFEDPDNPHLFANLNNPAELEAAQLLS